MAGAHGAGESIDGLRKQLLEFVEALGALIRSERVRHEKSEQHADPGKQDVLVRCGVNDKSQQKTGAQANQQKIPGAHFDIGLGEHFLQRRDPFRAAQQIVERRDLAEHFIAQQGDFFQRLGSFHLLGIGETIAKNARALFALVEQRKCDEHDGSYNDEHEDGNELRHHG